MTKPSRALILVTVVVVVGGVPASTAVVHDDPQQHEQHDPQPQQQPQQQNHQQQQQQQRSLKDTPLWYPNWSGGTNTCLIDCPAPPAPAPSSSSTTCHARPSYMSHQNLMKYSMEECCDGYYWWDLDFCMGESAVLNGMGDAGDGDEGGSVATTAATTAAVTTTVTAKYGGSYEWYADYTNFRCVQDCNVTGDATAITTISPSGDNNSDDDDNYQCGGLVTPDPSNTIIVTTETYAETSSCCTSKFSYLALGMCVASSEGMGSYKGSDRYYVDYANGRCVQDCNPSSPNSSNKICGGTITDSSTQLYANAPSCCTFQLSHLDPLLCETRSKTSLVGSGDGREYEGTFRLYPDLASGSCVIDHNPQNTIVCSIGYTCQLLQSSSYIAKLYPVSPAGVQECCEDAALGSSVNPDYCRSKTMGVVSNLWFVDYGAKLCRQDCEVDVDSPSCAINTDPTSTYDTTPKACCQSKLGYVNQAKCLSNSIANPNLPSYAGSLDYYVDYKASKCVQDCPLGNGGDCGGILEGSSTTLYRDAKRCCRNALGYTNLELCRDRSNSAASGTGKYYPGSGEDGDMICVKDTSALPCPSGETCQRATGWLSTLYDTISECCQGYTAMSETDTEHCLAASSMEGGSLVSDIQASEEYYVDWIHQKCVKNCPVDESDSDRRDCGGIAGGKWVDLFPGVDACCDNLHYIDRNDCVKGGQA
mmetsp:Transcript_18714/g.40525  ORF Transcript_18714/g.40525 Transcript_18714/m.40525 type:complete len:704 (-) Transcript_18714:151-2262(-)